MLELLKTLLGITDTSKDDILDFYLSKSEIAIKNYLNTDTIDEFSNQTVELAMHYYKNRDNLGITQMSQGSRSQSMSENIPKSIKDSLPKPKIKAVG